MAGSRLTIWTGTQTPFNLRADLACAFGVDEERVRVIAMPMGGSFGAKTFVRHEAPLAALARKAGRPVKVVLDRTEEFLTLNRHPSVIRVRIGAKHDGTLVAKELDCWVDTGAYADCGPGVSTKLGYAGVGPTGSRMFAWTRWPSTPTFPPTARFAAMARCSRSGPRSGPWTCSPTGSGSAHSSSVARTCCATATCSPPARSCTTCSSSLACKLPPTPSPTRRSRGKGLCVLLKGMQTPSRAAIAVERTMVGYVIRSAACEMGQGVRRSLQLMGARMLGCEPGQIEVAEPDTDTSPFDTRTTSSRTTHMMGRALEEAVRDLHQAGGEHGYGEVHNEGGLDPDTGQGIASTHWHQGAASAHVTVDEETGKLAVEHLHGVAYAGRVVNPEGADLQNEGSLTMGLGTALFEAIEFADGQVTNANLSDYNVPAIGDLPRRFTHEIIEREGAEVHGLGETVLPPVPAAIGNALYSLGLEVYELPIRRARARGARRAGGASPPPIPSRYDSPLPKPRRRELRIVLRLNGPPAELECGADEMLMDVLPREGLASVRMTCGIGVCGACTVLIDGEPHVGVPDARRRGPGPRSRPWRVSAAPIRCSAPSSTRMPSSAAGAPRASCSPPRRCWPTRRTRARRRLSRRSAETCVAAAPT